MADSTNGTLNRLSGNTNNNSASTIKPTNLECKNLYEYLKTRPQNILDKLYNHPTICLAVYRYLLLSSQFKSNIKLRKHF